MVKTKNKYHHLGRAQFSQLWLNTAIKSGTGWPTFIFDRAFFMQERNTNEAIQICLKWLGMNRYDGTGLSNMYSTILLAGDIKVTEQISPRCHH